LQAGFGGLEITDEGFKIFPSKLPKQWKSLTLKGYGRGDKDLVVK
jgi:trehalose/maltose hydrolase-like predicted phosphorylase